MKISKPIVFILLLCGPLLSPLRSPAEIVESSVAVVNDEIIFLSELEEYGKPYFEEIRKKTPPDETQEKLTRARRDVLNQLLENKLLEQEIKKRKVEVADKDVDAAVEDLLKQNRITLGDLKMALAKEGMTLTTLARNTGLSPLKSCSALPSMQLPLIVGAANEIGLNRPNKATTGRR